jgi:phenylalanine-4-hydroxylase
VFPVSRGIREPEHVDFSPIPDLAHDLLGHIPMLVSAEHRQFLRRISAAMANAESSTLDHRLYLANRASAMLRCQPDCPPHKRRVAEERVERLHRALGCRPSAFTEIGRLYLWSIEFGLLGNPEQFQVYGAGLLSSPAETRAVCMKRAPIRNLTRVAVRRDVRFSDLQSVYFVAADYARLEQLLSSVQRRWSPAQQRARVKTTASVTALGRRSVRPT